MSRGFYIVVKNKDRNSKPYVERVRWRYIYYIVNTANNRGLKEHIFYDFEGKISTERKRENTKIMGKKCNWRMEITYKVISRDFITKEWFLHILQIFYNGYEMVPNLLSYMAYRQRQSEWQKALKLVKTYRNI
jgi:hypothetical protein